MAEIVVLNRSNRPEPVGLDQEFLTNLYERLGFHDADYLLCRAVEDIAKRLHQCAKLWSRGDWKDLRAAVASINKSATQVGMPVLARIARDVRDCIDAGDRSALDATLARMVRIGEGSLTEVWGQQDMSI